MSRAAEQVLEDLWRDLPAGDAWPAMRRADGSPSMLAEALYPLADVLAQAEEAMESLVAQSDIRRATDLLAEYEAALGPDPAGRDPTALSIAQRQAIAHQRWTTRGPRTEAFFVALAAKLGVSITIDRPLLSVCGRGVCGEELVADPEEFIWRVNLPEVTVIESISGASVCGDPLGHIVPSIVEPVIRRMNPPHMTVVFSYPES